MQDDATPWTPPPAPPSAPRFQSWGMVALFLAAGPVGLLVNAYTDFGVNHPVLLLVISALVVLVALYLEDEAWPALRTAAYTFCLLQLVQCPTGARHFLDAQIIGPNDAGVLGASCGFTGPGSLLAMLLILALRPKPDRGRFD